MRLAGIPGGKHIPESHSRPIPKNYYEVGAIYAAMMCELASNAHWRSSISGVTQLCSPCMITL